MECVCFHEVFKHTLDICLSYNKGCICVAVVQEAVQFCVTVCEFSVANSVSGVRKMLPLVWSTDTAVKDAVVQAYRRLYLNPQGETVRSVEDTDPYLSFGFNNLSVKIMVTLGCLLCWLTLASKMTLTNTSMWFNLFIFLSMLVLPLKQLSHLLLGWKPRLLWTASLSWWWMHLWEQSSVSRK